MAPQDSFRQLMHLLEAGNDAAARTVFRRFARRLIALARSRLDEAALQKVDPEDVLQSVLRSFFARQQDGQFDIADWDSLWSLLTVLTLRKCVNRLEYLHADCRDVGREVSLQPADSAAGPWTALARDPTPSEAAMLTETVEELMRGLDERDRSIVTLHLQGYTIPEVSGHARCSERTVCRILDRVRKRVRRLHAEETA